jgi:hypothetical protein
MMMLIVIALPRPPSQVGRIGETPAGVKARGYRRRLTPVVPGRLLAVGWLVVLLVGARVLRMFLRAVVLP